MPKERHSHDLTHVLPLYSNVTEYTELSPDVASDVLSKRGLVAKTYVLYLSRVIEAKGIFELVAAYRASGLPAAGIQLLVVGRADPRHERHVPLAGRQPRGCV